MEKKHREKLHNTGKTQGKTQGISSWLECGHPDHMLDQIKVIQILRFCRAIIISFKFQVQNYSTALNLYLFSVRSFFEI